MALRNEKHAYNKDENSASLFLSIMQILRVKI
jgi:hypothetical protein